MWVTQMARFHELWVITRANNRTPIETFVAKNSTPNVHWVYVDLPQWASFWKKKERGAHLYYYLWQLAIYFVARKLQHQIRFDVVHHVTFGQYWVPSFLALLPVPFIWGPVGGGESAPRKFWPDFSNRGKIYETFRDLGRSFASINPVMYASARRAAVAIATTEQTAVRLRRLGAKCVKIHPQFGLTKSQMQFFSALPRTAGKPFRIVSIGRLIHWKGFHLSLRAFAEFHASHPESTYWLLSSGPERDRLKKMAERLGVADRVVFWGGFRTLEEVYAKLAECDVLVHPALHEAFGNVCLEGMAAGRPVVCLDLGGPALQVTEDTGIKVVACSPEQAVHELAEAFRRLAGNRSLCIQLGEAGQRRARENFDWDQKGNWMNSIYSFASGRFSANVLRPASQSVAKI